MPTRSKAIDQTIIPRNLVNESRFQGIIVQCFPFWNKHCFNMKQIGIEKRDSSSSAWHLSLSIRVRPLKTPIEDCSVIGTYFAYSPIDAIQGHRPYGELYDH